MLSKFNYISIRNRIISFYTSYPLFISSFQNILQIFTNRSNVSISPPVPFRCKSTNSHVSHQFFRYASGKYNYQKRDLIKYREKMFSTTDPENGGRRQGIKRLHIFANIIFVLYLWHTHRLRISYKLL